MEITPNILFYTAIISLGLGIIVGLFLFFFGRRRGKQKLGVIGLIVSLISGAIGPIMPLLVLAIFLFLILRRSKPDSATEISDGLVESAEDDSAL